MNKNKKNISIFHLKYTISTAVNNTNILYWCVMIILMMCRQEVGQIRGKNEFAYLSIRIYAIGSHFIWLGKAILMSALV